MSNKNTEKKLASLPSVDELLRGPAGSDWLGLYPRSLVLIGIRETLNDTRRRVLDGEIDSVDSSVINRTVSENLYRLSRPHLQSVINATGVILHTNLGRSPLAPAVLRHVAEVSAGYSNLEFNLAQGERGKRYSHITGVLCEMTGAEDALVVNNNAAAVLLCLTAMAAGKEVIVSRGELIEIGGAFRIPDVMKAGGAFLKEVGATNKTHLQDYESAIGEETAFLLKVHPSNYRVVGFTHEISLAELVLLGKAREIPVMYDLGSGSLIDLSKYGIPGEPCLRNIVASGVDLVTFSGDKLLGGPQGGVIVGKKKYIQQIQRHPLTRAVRVDKMTLAALEATLMLYRDEETAIKEIPVLAMLTAQAPELRRRANRLARRMRNVLGQKAVVSVVKEISQSGGGSLPEQGMETFAVAVKPKNKSVSSIEKTLRTGEPPVVSRVKDNTIIFDVRTLQNNEFSLLVSALNLAISG